MNKGITVIDDGEKLTHLPCAAGDYATLCGLDGNDFPVRGGRADVDQRTVETPDGQKITCKHCWAIWNECKAWRVSDFAKEARK